MTETLFQLKKYSNRSHKKGITSIKEILLCNDDERFEQLVRTIAKHHIVQNRHEAEAWHNYFRRIAADSLIFYQHNASLFYDDIQYENDQLQLNQSTYIHGDLHMGQFYYYNDELNNKRVFQTRSYQKRRAPITWDLKRLATCFSLIAYNKGFSDIEIIEIIDAFVRQYINSVVSPFKHQHTRRNSIENVESSRNKEAVIQRRNSVIVLSECIKMIHEIEWESINSVSSFITLVKQLAITVRQIHYEPPLSAFSRDAAENLLVPCKINDCMETIRTTLSSSFEMQKYLTEDIRHFAMIYAEIARRDFDLFFRNFRNVRVFKGTEVLNDAKILSPLVYTRRVAVLIVGGGIGGLATALNFAQAGIKVTLVEKNNSFQEVGAGMQLAPNCSRALDRLGILEKVQANAVFPKQIVWTDALSGECLTGLDLGSKFVEQFGYPYIVVHRADLLNALYEACLANSLVTLETNSAVTTVDERPQSIMVEFANGMRYNCDMVVAANGLRSNLRKFVCDDGDPVSVGYVTYRGTVGMDRIPKDDSLDDVTFWIGPDMHLVRYPVRRGEIYNLAAVFKSKRLPDSTDQWGTEEELNERFSIGCEQVKKILPLLKTNFRWPVYDRIPLSKWSRGRLVLLGDAAHPMLQYAAQGAAQALEDACALKNAYKKHGPSNIKAVFREYEQERIPISSRIVYFARDIGNFAHQSGDTKIKRDEILRIHNTQDFDCIRWLYEEIRTENN